MNKITIAASAILAAAFAGCTGQYFDIVRDGAPCTTIVAPADETVRSDIAFFTNAVFRCTGAALPVADNAPAKGRRIVFALETRDIPHEDAYDVSFPDADTMSIRGTAMSCRWALNRFLEHDLGVVFCYPGPHGTHYPQTNAFSIARTAFAGDASLKVERIMWREDPEWTRALGGKEQKGRFYNHNIWSIFPIEKYGKEPWLSKIMPADAKGRRVKPSHREMYWQPCFSSPEAVTEAVKNISEYLRANPKDKVFSLSVNDNGGYCKCARCKEANGGSLDRKSRFGGKNSIDYSRVYYKWASQVAKAVGREFPNVMFGLLAYGSTMDPPEERLPPNVVPFICGSVYQSHNEEMREKRLRQMREWTAKADSFGVWDYAYGALQYTPPRVYLKTVGDFFAHKTNDVASLNAMFAEGSSFMGEGPKRYFHYKMMFDAAQDREALVDAWYRACCGEKAAPYLKAYYDLWERFWTGDAVRKTHWYESIGNGYCAFNETTYLFALTRAELDKGTELMEKAYAAAMEAGDDDQKIRARRLLDFSRFYTARALACGAGGAIRDVKLKDIAAVKAFLAFLPEMSANMATAVEYAEKIAAVKRAEPFYMSEPYGSQIVSTAKSSPSIIDWLNDVQAFLGEAQVREAIESAAADKRIAPDCAKVLRSLLVEPRKSQNFIYGAGLDDAAERRMWEPPADYGIAIDSFSTQPDGNRVFEVTGQPGWPALKKQVAQTPGGPGRICGFSARVSNMSDKPIAVRITYTPGRGLDRKFTVKPGESGSAELIGTPGAKNINFYVILNGLPKGGRARVDNIVLRRLD